MYKTDEIAKNGVRLGDHITARGENVSKLLFDAQELCAGERYRGERSTASAAATAPATATPAPTSAPKATPTRTSR